LQWVALSLAPVCAFGARDFRRPVCLNLTNLTIDAARLAVTLACSLARSFAWLVDDARGSHKSSACPALM
jgi:hypothetical protein